MITNLKPYADKFQSIGEQAGGLLSRFESGNFTARDVSMLIDLGQQYCEALEEISIEGIRVFHPVTIQIDGNKIQFQNIESAAEFITDKGWK